MNIKSIIPITITSLNLACGTVGVVATFFGRIEVAFLIGLAGAFCDFFDGFSARALGTDSIMRNELDSLADIITFGLLPSLMLFEIMADAYGAEAFFVWIPLLIPVFSGLHLAKYNIDNQPGKCFLGPPTPVSAAVGGSIACYLDACPGTLFTEILLTPWVIPSVSVILCALLVCKVPFFTIKFRKGEGMSRDMVLRIIFAVISGAGLIVILACRWFWALAILLAAIVYISVNLVAAICDSAKKK